MLKKILFIGIVVFFNSLTSASADHEIEKSVTGPTSNGNVHIYDWVVTYENTGPAISSPGSVNIIDQLSSNQSVVSGSIQTPPNWSSATSGGEITFSNTGTVLSGGNIVHGPRDFPDINNHLISITGKGDGYKPIPYYPNLSKKKIYVVNHHALANQKSFHCYDLNKIGTTADEKKCGPAWPRLLPDGDPSTPSVGTPTSSANEEFQIINGKLYYAVTANNKWGFGCFDLDTETECGFTVFSSALAPQEKIGLEGPFRVENKIYFLDVKMRVHCYNLSLPGICSGYPKNVNGPNLLQDIALSSFGSGTNGHKDGPYEGGIGARIHKKKIFFTVAYKSAEKKKVLCFDTVTNAVCNGWGNASRTFASAVVAERAQTGNKARSDNWSNFFYYDPSMNPVAICNRSKLAQSCVRLDNGSSYAPSGLIYPTPTHGAGSGGEIVDFDNAKTFIPELFTNDLHCFDWTTQQVCSSPASPGLQNAAPPAAKIYAGAKDKYGCYWFYGDNNQLWSLDPTSGQSPCNFMSFSETYKAESLCSGKERNLVLQVNNISVNDFDRLELIIQDGGTTLPPIPLSQSSYSHQLNSSEVTYTIVATHADGVNTYTTIPSVSIIDKSKTEFCYKTQVECPSSGNVTNTASVSVNDSPVSGASITVEVDNPCPPKDEICLDLKVSDVWCRNGQLTGQINLLWDQLGAQGKVVEFSTSPTGTNLNPSTYTLPANSGNNALSFNISGLPNGTSTVEITGDYMLQNLSQPSLSSCCSASAKVNIPKECGLGGGKEPCTIQIERSNPDVVVVSQVFNAPGNWVAKVENISPAGTTVTPMQFTSPTTLNISAGVPGSPAPSHVTVTFDIVIYDANDPEKPACRQTVKRRVPLFKTTPPLGGGAGLVKFPDRGQIDKEPYSPNSGECAIGKRFKGSVADLVAVNLSPHWEAKPFNITPAGVVINPSTINSNTPLPVHFTSSGGAAGVHTHDFDLVFVNSAGKLCKHKFTLGVKRQAPGGNSTN